MKKSISSLLVLFALAFFFPTIAMATDYPIKVGEKLANGVANAVTGVVEIPKTMMITGRNKGATYGMTAGFFIGIVHTLGRSLTGALDIATFLVPTTPIVNPAYIWDDFNRETTYTAWRMR
ncbi:exosortase system-associated protein, TIGR04073 family [Nitrosomonas sp. Nm132]|jgi:putative exosortase-associated protein (TIGR04073 family)|uniref:exosortase system-associated protein, TIGR04073 family n=1 Tax=Nitrosomonas sp. Nm132 TaxID=1881053 RepID=UPI000885CF36|nr:exosortase system-associated protein, TIGR04073 family [Nitrosomonas sp. Nm132]SDH22416.1 putative exosortase-associated protein, TIGR04073 family [Nitrosomonas sp. Nm132]